MPAKRRLDTESDEDVKPAKRQSTASRGKAVRKNYLESSDEEEEEEEEEKVKRKSAASKSKPAAKGKSKAYEVRLHSEEY